MIRGDVVDSEAVLGSDPCYSPSFTVETPELDTFPVYPRGNVNLAINIVVRIY